MVTYKESMKIEIGILTQNRTAKYLVPGLNYYGPMLKTKLNLVYKLGFGVKDSLVAGTHLENQKSIYILIDKLVRPEVFQDFINWIKHQEYYIADYAYDDTMKAYSRQHMLVLAFPPSLGDAYDKFLIGKYSKMYTKTEIADYFSEDNKLQARNVLTRANAAKEVFRSKVKEIYDTVLTNEDFRQEVFEYDFPPKKSEECF